MICETKIDGSFPTEQFIIEGYSTIHRLDRNDRGGGIMFLALIRPLLCIGAIVKPN